jgi:hypothetical protein
MQFFSRNETLNATPAYHACSAGYAKSGTIARP